MTIKQIRLMAGGGILTLLIMLSPIIYAFCVLPLISDVYISENPGGTDSCIIVTPNYIFYGRGTGYPNSHPRVDTLRIDEKIREDSSTLYRASWPYSDGKGESDSWLKKTGSSLQEENNKNLFTQAAGKDARECWQRSRLNFFFIPTRCFDASCAR